MKYEEILGLNNVFQPVFDLENEIEMYWKRFIPNDKFYTVLFSVLNSLESDRPNKRKPIWLQGTYGTGKSHATSVIKHLLFDDQKEIKDFFKDPEVNFRLNNFRKEKRVFPVILKGTSNIHDTRTFGLVIQRAVKDSLKRSGIKIHTPTDFEMIISLLKHETINWENTLRGTELAYEPKERIISKLESGQITTLKIIEEKLSETNLSVTPNNISNWLKEVRKELEEQGKANYLMIYWDEFTGILNLRESDPILTELQNIAELSIKNGVYLFIVAHKTPNQMDTTPENFKKVLDRFEVINYAMESVTTYHLITASINKLNESKWKELRDMHIEDVKTVIQEILKIEGPTVQKSLQNLFPIHPYTAYLATFLARNIGSTDRSIFKFLYNEENGFKKFIKEYPLKNKYFLTADQLWDFFYDDFDIIENEKISSILERFRIYEHILEKEGKDYVSVFKGILLLNILHKVIIGSSETSLVAPLDKNIKNIFAGSINEKSLDHILNFIDNKNIINKNPDNLYLLTSSGLPQNEIESEKENLQKQFTKIDELLDKNQITDLESIIGGSTSREIEVKIMDSSLNRHIMRQKLDKKFNNGPTVNICLLLGKNDQNFHEVKNTLKDISKEKELSNIIFVLSEVTLEDKNFDKFLYYKAVSRVADKHNYSDAKKENGELATKIINNWINKVKSKYVEWFLQGRSSIELMPKLGNLINQELSKKLFSLGLENIENTQENRSIWEPRKSPKAVEIFLTSNNREDLISRTSKFPEKSLREILKDRTGEFIVDPNLNLKDISDDHPLKSMSLKIKESLEKEKVNRTFNLGENLEFLTKQPYGLCTNMISMATIGFLMREYNGKLFDTVTSAPIRNTQMRDKIDHLFSFWKNGKSRNKLNVRFGSEDENELMDILIEIFDLENINNLNDARWKVRKWVNEAGFPIWVFKCDDNINEKTKKALDNIFKLITSMDKELDFDKISEYLSSIEDAKVDLKLLIHKEKATPYFKKWIGNLIEISSEDIKEVISYIQNNMGEVSFWAEYNVKEKVLNWEIKRLREKEPKQPEEPKKTIKPIISTSTTEGSPITESNEHLNNIKAKIEFCEGETLKEVIYKIIEEMPRVITVIEKYLEK